MQCVVTLLSRGADPNIADLNGNTPLHTAASLCCPALVQVSKIFLESFSLFLKSFL